MNRLASFLENPARPPGTLRYHALQGFLFAVASAAELVRPSEWLPVIFGDQEPEFDGIQEAQAVLGELMAVYNTVNACVAAGDVALPADCRFRTTILANFENSAAISLWSRGILRGYEWLEDTWNECLPEELDRDFALLLIALSFFASKELALDYGKELGRPNLEQMATDMRRVFPDAMAEYARIGRSIQKVPDEDDPRNESRAQRKVGRNDPCPCGSGRKYKKCCGAGA